MLGEFDMNILDKQSNNVKNASIKNKHTLNTINSLLKFPHVSVSYEVRKIY